uniref:General transcription factor IIIC subunit 4 n=1 Tax=Suricata suricatta TaxID=37032 RepID=A0A673VTP5_SURSU
MSSADKARVGLAADGPAPPEEEEGEGGGEAGGKEPAADAAPGPSAAFRFLVTRREPAVKLQYAVSGLEPLAWSEDHRVSVSTARSIAVLELICDVHNPGQDLVIHRTSVPAPLNSCLLKVLIGHISKKMNKQTFPEHCSLCKEVLPFTDRKQAVCSNGHIWLRCFLTYQSCQSLIYRRCLLHDSIARHPAPEGECWPGSALPGPSPPGLPQAHSAPCSSVTKPPLIRK